MKFKPFNKINLNVKELSTQYKLDQSRLFILIIKTFVNMQEAFEQNKSDMHQSHDRSDLFDKLINDGESQLTIAFSSHQESCGDQSISEDANSSQKVDLFGEPWYNIQAEPTLRLSIPKAAERLTKFIRAVTAVEEEKTASVEKMEIQNSDSERDSPSCQQSNFEEQKRKYLLKKEKKEKKEAKGKKEPYPTKNFLPAFRSSFLNFLEQFFTEDQFYDFQIIRRIKGKPCINLKDYQDLFNQKEFRPHLKKYFENGVIARDLMTSRIDYEVKMAYMDRIHVFQEAYESGVFKKIN